MSILKCPLDTINLIKNLQHDFLWQGCEEFKKIHLVNWKTVCSPIDTGGLGIRPLRIMSPVRKMVMENWGKINWSVEKHPVSQIQSEEKWLGHPSYLPKYSTFWKWICSPKDTFAQSICYRVGNGEKISFWHNAWVGVSSLADQYPDLYRCARNYKAWIRDYLDTNSNRNLLCPIFRKNLYEAEEAHLLSLLEVLNGIDIAGEGQDSRSWGPSKDGTFSVSSFFSTLSVAPASSRSWSSLWKIKALPEC